MKQRLPMQIGGRGAQQTGFATHMLRTYCNLADKAGLSFGVLFFDVKAAFHSMLCEHAFGNGALPSRLCDILAAADLDVDQLCRDSDAHSQLFISHLNLCLQRAVQDAHCFKWCTVDGHDGCHRAHRVSRPGSPLADIAYNYSL